VLGVLGSDGLLARHRERWSSVQWIGFVVDGRRCAADAGHGPLYPASPCSVTGTASHDGHPRPPAGLPHRYHGQPIRVHVHDHQHSQCQQQRRRRWRRRWWWRWWRHAVTRWRHAVYRVTRLTGFFHAYRNDNAIMYILRINQHWVRDAI